MIYWVDKVINKLPYLILILIIINKIIDYGNFLIVS